ncbi:MAG TPA: hypothetical protein VKE88_02330 [Candidatus Nanoarchaeia archaeon]|nr:hypothetical protein [Candidatus Nanoarchaeia archaeon]
MGKMNVFVADDISELNAERGYVPELKSLPNEVLTSSKPVVELPPRKDFYFISGDLITFDAAYLREVKRLQPHSKFILTGDGMIGDIPEDLATLFDERLPVVYPADLERVLRN